MGTTGIALFADDYACDVRDAFLYLLRAGWDPADATAALIQEQGAAIDDPDEGPRFWLALAATQWKYGCLDPEALRRAVNAIDTGAGAARWTGAAAIRRRAVLAALRVQLHTEQPRFRRPRRRPQVVVPSVRVLSPDGMACAVAHALGPSTYPGAPTMQVRVDMLVDGAWGGGHVVLADCSFDAVTMVWLDAHTLQIRHPATAVLSRAGTTAYQSGRTIQIMYVPAMA